MKLSPPHLRRGGEIESTIRLQGEAGHLMH
ncbi:Uncharacterised protein [Vibrio cholerae]|nr:Uncharacterised protein [Vibrio cholerae]CSC98683.1 Uncharacterised protein [Vibrio cholerae]